MKTTVYYEDIGKFILILLLVSGLFHYVYLNWSAYNNINNIVCYKTTVFDGSFIYESDTDLKCNDGYEYKKVTN